MMNVYATTNDTNANKKILFSLISHNVTHVTDKTHTLTHSTHNTHRHNTQTQPKRRARAISVLRKAQPNHSFV